MGLEEEVVVAEGVAEEELLYLESSWEELCKSCQRVETGGEMAQEGVGGGGIVSF